MSNESRDRNYENGNLVSSPLCGFRLKAALKLQDLKLNLFGYLANATTALNLPFAILFLIKIVDST